MDGDKGKKKKVSLPVHGDRKALIGSPSLNLDKSPNSRIS